MEEESREQRIRERAYAIWEEEGRPDHRAEANWLQAEAEIADAGDDGEGEENEAGGEAPAEAPARASRRAAPARRREPAGEPVAAPRRRTRSPSD